MNFKCGSEQNVRFLITFHDITNYAKQQLGFVKVFVCSKCFHNTVINLNSRGISALVAFLLVPHCRQSSALGGSCGSNYTRQLPTIVLGQQRLQLPLHESWLSIHTHSNSNTHSTRLFTHTHTLAHKNTSHCYTAATSCYS